MEHNHMLPRPAHHTISAGLDQKHDPYPNDQRQTPSSDVASVFQSLDRPFKLPMYSSPPSYAQTHGDRKPPIAFPDAPTTELPPLQLRNGYHGSDKKDNTLPSLSSLTVSSPKSMYISPPPQTQVQSRPTIPPPPTYAPPPPPKPAEQLQPTHWPSLNPYTAYYTPSHAEGKAEPLRMDTNSPSTSAISSASSETVDQERSSNVSLDDPDVRLAAEALGDLRADFVSSPRNVDGSSPSTSRSRSQVPPEPLLQLITTNHPLLGGVIEGTQTAYVASKNYSPRFKSGAEYVEGYVAPVVNTVGSVGRVTGVEGSVRWFLGAGKRHKSQNSADMEEGSNKRRKGDDGTEAMILDSEETPSGMTTPRPTYDPNDPRRLSIASTIQTIDTLPAYDEHRSPAYEAEPRRNSLQSRLIMSTSGLSIAMSQESLRSLKYCLSWLRWANVHIANVINSLKLALDRYDKMSDSSAGSSSDGDDRQKIVDRINTVKADVVKTFQDVIQTVSKYAGGALPENARVLVRRHLTSLPQRFALVNMLVQQQRAREDQNVEEGDATVDRDMRDGAQTVLLMAKEGLDMMSQVSGVLDGTIVSAEEWCDRLGKRKQEQKEVPYSGQSTPSQYSLETVKTG
ncbi:transcription factor Opi1-domain-containing protein [Truncatella angustata]|uniref:Transcription factor Opi1-domain-containing protein n=1 Tax=Truncatella angustata TaxID=152316 RepID=A0A9P9A1G3_9PEZI|nr:transcription factor Opi1-domain-containing protein [Truncatella angustata]KAH6658308.1 transcription factor Opi1-domain-containing protein [Truncatella angustata]